MAGTSLFCFDSLDDVEEAEGNPPFQLASIDGEWECLCDYHRTGELVELTMRIYGQTGYYSVNGNAHRLFDIVVSQGQHGFGSKISATFRWANRSGSAGKGMWSLSQAGNYLDGSWTVDGNSGGPWSWCGYRKGVPQSERDDHSKGLAARQHHSCCLDGDWDCACDIYRTGRPIHFTMTMKGTEGSFSVDGSSHKLSELDMCTEKGAVKVSFRWTAQRHGFSSRGSGTWMLNKLGDSLEGGWTQDGVDGGPWSWKCTRRGTSPPTPAAAPSRPSAPPVGATGEEKYVLKLEGFMGDVADPPLDDLDALRTAYAELRVGRDRPVWGDDKLTELPGIENMRAGEYNMFVWQTYADEDCQAATDAILAAGGRSYFELTKEDGGEGVLATDVNTSKGDSMLVSRDLLDSVSEMMFLERESILERKEAAVVVDIGAGYGRLARRMTEVFPNITYYATDGIPESTYFAHKYLTQHCSRAQVIPLSKVGLLLGVRPKLAINVHSFSEQSEEDASFWIHLMARAGARYFFIVPNSSTDSIMFFNGRRAPLNPILESAGYRLERMGSHFGMGRCRDKYFLWSLQSTPDA